jgi:MFS family permease
MDGATRDALVRRNTRLLMGAQAALLATSATWFSLSVVAVVDLTGHDRYAGIFLALFNLCVAAGALATGRAMDRVGRRPGLAAGHLLLGLGGTVGAVAIWQSSTALLFVASVILGPGLGAALLNRVAVADMYPARMRGRVVGVVLSAGTVGAIAGAPVAAAIERVTGSKAIPWLMIPAFELIALAIVLALRPDTKELAVERDTPQDAGRTARSVRELVRVPPVRAAMAAIAVAQTAMVAVMGVTPVAISDEGGSTLAIAVVIGLHIGGMYALGPVIGSALDRYGRRPGLLAGCALSATGAIVGSFAHEIALVGIGMTLVGLGWAGCYVGATAVISDLTSAEERGSALGATDLVTSLAAAAGVLGSGFVLESAGLGLVGAVMAALMVPVALLVLPLRETAPGRWAIAAAVAGKAR